MLQRIQSLYLFVALILIGVCFFLPVADISFPKGDLYSFNLNGYYLIKGSSSGIVENVNSLLFVGLLICSLILTTIFIYKSRPLQIRLCVYIIILSLGLSFLFFFVLYRLHSQYQAHILYHIASVLPVISAILGYLALRAIKKDDDMVKSYDRLR
jgi:hypothetical protein